MPQMVDEAGNIWEVDAQGNPVSFVGKQGAQQGPAPVTLGTPRAPEAVKPQTMKLDDGSVVQIFPDGATRTVVQGTPKTGGTNPKGGTTAKIRDEALQAYNDAIALRRVAADLRTRNKTGAGATTGLAGVQDFFPTADNSSFDTAAQRARGYVKRSLGFTGGEGNTIAESSTLYDPYLPSTSDWDGKILDKISALEQLADDAERKSIATLGGVPDRYGNITQPQEVAPQPQQQNDQAVAGAAPQQDRSNQAAVLFGGPGQDGGGGGFVPYGATMKTEANPQWKGVNQAVKGMIVAGRSPDEIKAFLNSKGIAGDAARGVDDAINYFRKTGKDNFGVDVEKIQVPMSGFEQFRNNAPQTGLGTAAATALNAGGFGIPQAIAGGEGLDYLRSQNPGSAFAGDVAGVIGGTAALGRAGGSVAGKLAPSLLGGGAKSAGGRQLATDVGYGAIYGGTTEGTPQGALTGALTAGLGSAGGQIIGKGIKTLGQGITAPAAARLYDEGITPTLGQIGRARGGIIGNAIGGLEDRIAGLPFIGEAVGNARNRGLQQSNVGDLNNALKPVGGKVTDYGTEGYAAADDVIGEAYQAALDPMRLQIDDGLRQAMDSVPQYRDIIEQNLDNGMMTGRGFQAAKRTIDGEIASASGTPMGYKTLPPLQTLRDSMFQSAEAQAPDLLQQYRLADEAYNNLVPIRAATAAAENTGGLYTPAQLGRSLRSTDRSVGKRATARGERPGQDLQTLKQDILPAKVPDSGTVGRGLVAAGVGLPAFGGATINPLIGLAALPAAAYTKLGQDLVAKALLAERPKLARQGAGIFGGRKARKALSGAITAPLLTDY